MAINRSFKNKDEWQKGYDYGHAGIVKALDENPNKTKQGIYVAGRTFNKKMAKENVTDNPKSDDFLAGMETAIQEEFQARWEKAPSEQIKVSAVEGMPGLVHMQIPVGYGSTPLGVPINPTPVKKIKKSEPSPAPKKPEEVNPEDDPDYLDILGE